MIVSKIAGVGGSVFSDSLRRPGRGQAARCEGELEDPDRWRLPRQGLGPKPPPGSPFRQKGLPGSRNPNEAPLPSLGRSRHIQGRLGRASVAAIANVRRLGDREFSAIVRRESV